MTAPTGDGLQVRAVRHTDRPERWRPVVTALGAIEVPGRPDERVFALAGGILVLRPAGAGNPVTAIELATPEAFPVDHITGADGMCLPVVRTTAGATVGGSTPSSDPGADAGADANAGTNADANAGTGASSGVTVCPLWMSPDVPGATDALIAAGLTVRLSSDAGQWVDLLAPGGGLLAVHSDSPPDPDTAPRAVLAFETADVAALAARFAEQDLRADIVDESYGRSLRIDDPDGGIELWVNETMTDLYGYRRHEGARPGVLGPHRGDP